MKLLEKNYMNLLTGSNTCHFEPIAVLISDVHYSLATLDLADKAFCMAVKAAHRLGVPLIDCGDLTNDKAIIRAEVMNRLIKTFRWATEDMGVRITCLVGNHSLINEKGKEHALKFLSPYADIISLPLEYHGFNFIPYQSSNEDFLKALHEMPKDNIVIAHQGFQGANMGDYVQDRSSVDPKDCVGYRIISGHYHRHQTLEEITYVGNPYTLTFGEAEDGPKGFLVLYEDGSVSKEFTRLRTHVIFETSSSGNDSWPLLEPDDLLWVKITGPRSELQQLSKKHLSETHDVAQDFRLDLIPTNLESISQTAIREMRDDQVFDMLIDKLPDSEDYKNSLKTLWRSRCE